VTDVRIVTDSACDLPAPLAASLGIEIVPLTVRFGDQEFVDRVDLTPAEFWARCAASDALPETAAPAPGAFEATFRRLASAGAPAIVCITLSSALSATMQSAQVAARAVADDIAVDVIDSRSVTMGLGMIAVGAGRLARTGADARAVVDHAATLIGRTRVFGTLATLENLKKGGRIGGAKALVASMLAIKPRIEGRDGEVHEAGRQRTRTRALAHLVDIVRRHEPVDNLAVMHADSAEVDEFVRELAGFHAGDIVVGDIGAVIGTHACRGTIGVVFQTP